jgi:hypothetical protein
MWCLCQSVRKSVCVWRSHVDALRIVRCPYGYRDNDNNKGTQILSRAIPHRVLASSLLSRKSPIGDPAISNRHSGTWTLSSRCREGERKAKTI